MLFVRSGVVFLVPYIISYYPQNEDKLLKSAWTWPLPDLEVIVLLCPDQYFPPHGQYWPLPHKDTCV